MNYLVSSLKRVCGGMWKLVITSSRGLISNKWDVVLEAGKLTQIVGVVFYKTNVRGNGAGKSRTNYVYIIYCLYQANERIICEVRSKVHAYEV